MTHEPAGRDITSRPVAASLASLASMGRQSERRVAASTERMRGRANMARWAAIPARRRFPGRWVRVGDDKASAHKKTAV